MVMCLLCVAHVACVFVFVLTANFSVQQFPSGSPPKINLKKFFLLPRAPKVHDYDHPSPQIFNQYPYKWLMKTSPKSRIER